MVYQVFKKFFFSLSVLLLALSVAAQDKKKCFSADVRAFAETRAKVWHDPAGYNPVLGYDPAVGARMGAPKADDAGLAAPISCVANVKTEKGSGTTPKFYCSVEGVADADGELVRYKVKPHFKGASKEKRNGEVYGEFLASRFSQALGFYADDEWVADVSCPDCEKSLTSKFQGASFNPFQPAAGIELSIGKGIDVNCDGKDSGALASSLDKLAKSAGGNSQAEVDALKIWLAFIDHGDTKTDNHEFVCLKWSMNGDKLACEQSAFYVSDMGSTFGYSSASENKARLAVWKKRADPLKMDSNRCQTTAKSVGNTDVSEAGRALLTAQLQKLLDMEASDGAITKVFAASRNGERDEAPAAWTAEFMRRAKTVINAKCSK